MSFPPQPSFPFGIDNDYTLFLVYNTTETRICKENYAWSDEIEIIPVRPEQPEIWADNGFGNIDGEMFYYDSVRKNEHGKVFKLRQCARNLGGDETKYNPPGTWVRSYVVAEHHNQMVNAIERTEDFIGYNFDPRTETLDWRIRNLEDLDVIFDDFSCPDITFTFNEIENSPTGGILTEYLIQMISTGSTGALSFRLDFGDGQYTTTELTGTHRYALNATVDPVLTVTNDRCQLVITPVERANPSEPPSVVEEVFDIPIPQVPTVPDFIVVTPEVPQPDINLPPIVFPCGISVDGGQIDAPDYINIPFSTIEITGPDINLPHSVISIIGPDINIPSIVIFDVPPTIVVDPPIPPTIVILPDSSISNVQLSLNALSMPKLEIDWGMSPEINVALTLPKRTRMVPLNGEALESFGDEFADLMLAQDQMKIITEEIGIPEEIHIIPPTMPKIEFDLSNFPRKIEVDTSEVHIPDIKIHGPDAVIPDNIQIYGPATPLPEEIRVVGELPESIELISKIDIPKKIDVELSSEIPSRIMVETITPIPEKIILEATGIPNELRVTGIPDTIGVVGFPEFIPLQMPENAQIEMVYRGAPIDVKVDLQPILAAGPNGEGPCFQLVRCT